MKRVTNRNLTSPHVIASVRPSAPRGRSLPRLDCNFVARGAQLGVLAFAVASFASCSWGRYDDVLRNSPIQILKAPSDLTAFGQSVAAVRADSSSYAFASGYEGFAVYAFDKNNLRSNDPIYEGACRPRNSCWQAASVAPLNRSIADVPTACFAYGVTTANDGTPAVALHCMDGTLQLLPLPDPAPPNLAALRANTAGPVLRFASGPRLAPDWLVVAVPENPSLWFYAPDAAQPVTIALPTPVGASFGATLAVSGSGAQRRVWVGEPEAAILHVYTVDSTGVARGATCIQGPRQFSSALAIGHFAPDGAEDIAVASDEAIVAIHDISNLVLSEDPAAPCVALSDLATVSEPLTCEALSSSSNCSSLFSDATLAAADVNGDGLDELVVGTPSAPDRSHDAAGRVYVVQITPTTLEVLQGLTPSSIESGDRFGSSIVGVPLSRPEVILAGVPGGNKLAALFCTNLLVNGQGGTRCE
jgi:hypothetical protein